MELAAHIFRCVLPILGVICVTEAGGEWGYEEHNGPHRWKDLFPEACSGKYQSPINIHRENTIYNRDLREFAIWYDPPRPGSNLRVLNNGHTVQINTNGDFFVTNGGLKSVYKTVQFHFHWGAHNKHGSEHLLDGETSPIELHIVNYNFDKYDDITEAVMEPQGLAVLGVMFEISLDDNPILQPIIEALEKIKDPDVNVEVALPSMSMRDLLPTDVTRYYRYNGSLTTPGCFESVIWTLFDDKQTISEFQLLKFREVMKRKKYHHHRKHSKRSARKDRKKHQGAEAVIDELGIKGDNYEKKKLKEELMEKMEEKTTQQSSETNSQRVKHNSTTLKPVESLNEKETGHEHVVAYGNGKEGEGTSYIIDSGKKGNEDNEEEDEVEIEIIQDQLVDNFRPIQPLNERIIYRSFTMLHRQTPRVFGVSQEDSNSSKGNINLTTILILFLSAAAIVFFE